MSDDFKFVLDDKVVTLEHALKAEVIVAGDEDNVVRLFQTQSAFHSWAEKSEHADKLAQTEKLIARSLKYKNADNTRVIKRQQSTVKRISKELKELADATGLPLNSEELFLKATVDFHPLEGPIFDPAILYEHVNRGGRGLPLISGNYPNFNWLGFNDMASSVIRSGDCILWANIWYGGRQLFLAPRLLPASVNLTAFGFNDVASSAIIY